MKSLKKILTDPAFWALIGLNVIFINEFKEDPKQYTTIIWLYWCQSVMIGIFNFLDMLTLKNEVTKPNAGNALLSPNTTKGRGCFPFFFLFHYGGFHLVYLVFLLADFKISNVDFSLFKWAIFGIFINQLIVFIQHKTVYSKNPRNIGTMFISPYLRVVPMHLTIMIPKFFNVAPGITFLILKTVFDVIGHLIVTKYYWTDKQPQPEEGYI